MINVGEGHWETTEFVWKPQCVLNIPRCTHDIPPVYSWYSSSVLNTTCCTHDIPHTHHGIPRCTRDIPQSTEHPPGVLMISPVYNDIPQCTEHPPAYCTDIMQGGTKPEPASSKRTREANPVGENSSFVFTFNAKTVPPYQFQLV